MKKNNPYEEKFMNPNANFDYTTNELRVRITNLELDLININDPELKGFAQKLHTELSIQYFKLLRDDLTLQAMYEEDIDMEE